MKTDTKIIIIVLVIVLTLVLGGFFIVKHYYLDPLQNKWDNAKAYCDSINNTCDKYGCYATLSSYSLDVQRNFLLAEQNCLLREPMNN